MTVSSLCSLRQFKDELLMALEAFGSHTHLVIACCIVRTALWISASVLLHKNLNYKLPHFF